MTAIAALNRQHLAIERKSHRRPKAAFFHVHFCFFEGLRNAQTVGGMTPITANSNVTLVRHESLAWKQ
jgi:hypothetical protein